MKIEINPLEQYAELQAMRKREVDRHINETLAGYSLTKVQRTQLEIELENSTSWEGGELIPFDHESGPLRDPHGHEISISDHIRQLAETSLSTPLKPAGTNPIKAPADGAALFKAMKAAATPEERAAIFKAFKEQ